MGIRYLFRISVLSRMIPWDVVEEKYAKQVLDAYSILSYADSGEGGHRYDADTCPGKTATFIAHRVMR